MLFSKLLQIIGLGSSSSSTEAPSSSQYMLPPGLPPHQSGVAFANSLRKNSNNLRLSASLQDLAAYRHLNPEEGDIGLLKHPPPPHLLQRENAGSSFSKEKPTHIPFLRRRCVRAIIFVLCLLLLAFLVYMVAAYIYSNWSRRASKFYVVLDCGSTGTRVYVYQASFDQKKDGTFPIVMKSYTEGLSRIKPRSETGRAYDRVETEPGFDKLLHNVTGLRAAINPLIQWAEKQIPQHAHKSTSLFLHATAGLRRMPVVESTWILDKAWSILKNSPFSCKREWVKIITGVEEAYFGWTALNYQKSVLGTRPKKETFGALDLGGSSLQVTFESKKEELNKSNLNIKIGAATHHLSAYSLAGYGLNDAFGKSVVTLLKKLPKADLVSGNIKVKHPCLHSGYKEQYKCPQCATLYQESRSPLTEEKSLTKGGKPGISVQLIGAPNWEKCSALAKLAVNLSEWSNQSQGIDCDLQPCAIPVGLPHPYGHFYAISGFFVVYRFFNLTSEAALDDVLEKGREFCEKNWEVAKTSVAPQPFIEQYCFRAPYIVLLLREGLHITENQVVIGSGGITWTLGVALLQAGSAFPARVGFRGYDLLQMKINPMILMAILFISLIFVICLLSCVGNWGPRFFRRSYLPLFRHNSSTTGSVLNIPSPFRIQRWSHITSGDGRIKAPLSPTISGGQQGPFGFGHGLGGSGGNIQLMDSSLYPSASGGVSHSYSSNSLGQMQYDSGGTASFWSPHRSQTRLQSRRSQSREDLSSSIAETHMVKP
ncbi:hypothetical protein ACFE04_023439 [Oxalis oulophora]